MIDSSLTWSGIKIHNIIQLLSIVPSGSINDNASPKIMRVNLSVQENKQCTVPDSIQLSPNPNPHAVTIE